MTATPARPATSRALRAAGLVTVLAALAAMAVALVAGVRLVPVLTGSMTPYAPAGSLVLTVPVAGADLTVGDVVAFRPPAPYEVTGGHPILHRVAALGSQGSEPFMQTKGDANPAADPWRVSTRDAEFARAVVVVPFLGRFLAGGSGTALALVLGGGAVLAGAGTLRRTPRAPAGRRPVTLTGDGRPYRQTVTVALDVPAEQWDPARGHADADTRAQTALHRALTSLDLTLGGEPVRTTQPDGAGGVRLTLTAEAVAA